MDAGILTDRGLPDPTRRCLERFFAWGAAPTVDAYCDLFASGGTLLDADMERPISGAAIRESIGRVLTLLPDFRFTPARVLAEGPHAFVLAANRATLGDRPLAWEAIYALTLAGDRIAAGRRYYDRAALLDGSARFVVPPTNGGPPAPSAQGLATADLGARAAAWRRGDVGALAAPLGPVRLFMAGVGRPLASASEIAAALAAFTGQNEGLVVEPGAVVRGRVRTTIESGAAPVASRGTGAESAEMAVEWIGTIGGGSRRRRFAFVELVTAAPELPEWRVLFDTFGL